MITRNGLAVQSPRGAAEHATPLRELVMVPPPEPSDDARLTGSSAAMVRLRRMIDRVAPSGATVLVRGETGSGKERVARALHEESPRGCEPFIAVNCAALPETLIEAQLFGHERGAFSGAERRVRGQLELAGRGTLFFDEIAEMTPRLQAKLLRLLEDRHFRPLGSEEVVPFSARILAATHAELETRVREGTFRQDLYYRLSVVTLVVPPLRERLADLPELVAALVAGGPRPLRLSSEAMTWLGRRSWPGNVRELRNLLERVALLGETEVVSDGLLAELADRPTLQGAADLDAVARSLLALPSGGRSRLRLVETALIRCALEAAGGNKSHAARLLGVNRKVVERKLSRRDE
jgi:DNA-binding NtrC family response regulator